jgi:hypothetical protein
MIARFNVCCPGCEAKITLRIGVGYAPEQPFYFVCPNCRAATKARLIADEPPNLSLELEEGRVLDTSDKQDHVITLHADFPSAGKAASLSDPGSSPFILNTGLLGDNFHQFEMRTRQFRDLVQNDWVKLKRLISYYLDANWKQFDTEGKKILTEAWPSPNKNWHRHALIHRVLDMFTMPILVESYYVDMKTELAKIFSFQTPEATSIFTNFANECVTSGEVNELQRKVFHCFEMFIDANCALLPALPVLLYTNNQTDEDLRLFRDDFPTLRDLYTTISESSYMVLKYVVAAINIYHRGDPLSYEHQGPKTWLKFAKMDSAKKESFLKPIPTFRANWNSVLDLNLRNDIAHYAARHDLPSGNLVFRDRKMSYLDFVVKSLRLIHAVLVSTNILKLVCLAPIIGKE